MIKFLSPLVVVLVLIAVIASVGSKLKINQSSDIANACSSPVASGEFEADPLAIWLGKNLSPPSTQIAQKPQDAKVLGAADESKWIDVDLSDQTLRAFQGGQQFLETKISSGKFGRTPVGEYRIWIKLRYTKMEGGIKGSNTYYYLPNVPYTMFFYNDQIPQWRGFGLHGTYWHNNFGQPMSHGCVNLPTDMAGRIFYWTDPQLPEGKNMVRSDNFTDGTRIVIHD